MVDYFDGRVATLIAENVSEEKQAVESAAMNMIDQGATVIIGTSYGYMDTLDAMAAQYPDITFLHFSGNKMNDTNFGNYFGAMEEPRYLAGMVAGMMTKSNKIGYVAAFPYTELLIGINAFTLGARAVNPDAEVKVVYTNAWVDAANEKAAAEALLAQGCDVLEQHCDTTGPQIAAEKAGAYAIG
jgi:basic membrane protein A